MNSSLGTLEPGPAYIGFSSTSIPALIQDPENGEQYNLLTTYKEPDSVLTLYEYS